MSNLDFSNLPSWNLDDLYKGGSDSADLKKDLTSSLDLSKKFAEKYQDKIENLSGDDLYLAIKESEEITEILGKVSSFAYLYYVTDMISEEKSKFFQDIGEKINDISGHLVFFELEIGKLSDANLDNKLKNSTKLSYYVPYLRDVRIFKDHQLDKNIEKLFLEKSVTSGSAWSRLFDETMAGLEFKIDNKTLSASEIFNLMSSPDSRLRKSAAKEIGNVLGKNIKIFTYITNILAKDKEISDKWRNFSKPISSRNLSNFIEDEVVDSLVSSVRNSYPKLSHRYYKIKAKMLGQDKLNYWDRNAPLSQDEEKISWDDAKAVVLEAYNDFSPKIAEIGKLFFDNNWIDVPPRKGKDSGAFAHPTVPSAHPYLMLNYQGKVRDVMTLAHELGHGVHQYLARDKGYFMSGTPLTLAETASVFGEQLTFRKILSKENNADKKRIIIANKIEDMLNTVVRQIAFLTFEKHVHQRRREEGELSSDELNKIWMSVQSESLGDGIIFEDEYKYYWSYIPHFIHSPFYVYSYAFGDCLVNSLYSIYLKGNIENFQEKYIDMLKSGGTLHHKDLLAPFGLDASKSDFWQNGLNMIAEFIDMIDDINTKS